MLSLRDIAGSLLAVSEYRVLGATTVGTGETGPPTFRLAVIFKKQEISQQVVTRMQDLASEFSQIFRG